MSENKKILVLIISSFFISFSLCFDFFSPEHLQSDYLTFYSASLSAETGNDPYIVENLVISSGYESVYPYLYTPFPLTVFSVFNSGNFILSQTLWAIFNIIIFQLIISLVFKIVNNDQTMKFTDNSGKRGNYFFLFSSFIMIFILLAFRENIKIGQVNILTLLFISMAIYAAQKGKSDISGLSMAAAILIKTSPALLIIPLVYRLKFKFIRGLVVGLAAFFLISVLQFGLEPWQQYLDFLGTIRGYSEIPGLFKYTVAFNNSLLSLSGRILGETSAAYSAYYLGIIIIIIIIVFKQRKLIQWSAVDFLPWLTLMVIASPLSYRHHSIYLYAPSVAMLISLYSKKNYRGRYFSISLFLIFLAWCGYNFLRHYVPLIEAGRDMTFISGLGLFGYIAIFIFYFFINDKFKTVGNSQTEDI